MFVADAGVIVPAGATPVALQVTAALAGSAGNTAPGGALAPATGITGTVAAVVAASGLGGGAEIEADDLYRSRLLFARAFPEHAGAPGDWLRYTLAVPGVTRAYLDPLAAGRGTVVVYPFFDGARAGGLPNEAERLIVKAALDVARPGAGLPVVRIAQAVPVNVTLTGLSPAAPEVRAAVANEIAAAFARNARPAGFSAPHPSMPFLAVPTSFSRSWIWQAAANATGEERHSVTAPAADIALTEGQIATLGTLTFA